MKTDPYVSDGIVAH